MTLPSLGEIADRYKAERDELRLLLIDMLIALEEIARLRLATEEGTLRVRADRMWEIATAARALVPSE